MSYVAEISRASPSCFVFLIDQSGSMQEGWAGEVGKNKAQALSTIINRLLQNLVLKCAKSEGVRDYYDVGVIGYSAAVGPAFTISKNAHFYEDACRGPGPPRRLVLRATVIGLRVAGERGSIATSPLPG